MSLIGRGVPDFVFVVAAANAVGGIIRWAAIVFVGIIA